MFGLERGDINVGMALARSGTGCRRYQPYQ